MKKKSRAINIHSGGLDVPDILHPGDWLVERDGYDIHSIVVRLAKHEEGEWDSLPGAESWTITHLGIGYLTGENLSEHDCCFINHVIAVDGKLLPLYKDSPKRSLKKGKKPSYVKSIPPTVWSLIRRMNPNGFVPSQDYPQSVQLPLLGG